MKRILFLVLAAIVLIPALVIAIEVLHEPGSDQTATAVASASEQIARGAYLARAGNCMTCHTVRGGQEYAGGRAITTPFGKVYSSNLTPDEETGIGRWTPNDFWRAIHNGKSKDGRFLYPAFPYPNYTKVTRQDSDAMYAYLRTVAPVKQESKAHELRFPYNQRILLAFWRTLYFNPEEFQPQANQTPEWNRGAYLVQGLGHCSACHTPRNALGGSIAENSLAGGMIPMQNWYASSLASGPGADLGEWETKDIEDLLKTGVSQRGAVFGPMSEVVANSLQHLSNDDIHSIASYLKSLPKSDAELKTKNVQRSAENDATLRQGAGLYERHCMECHKADGKGAPPAYPSLAGNRSLMAQSAVNPIRIVLNGGYPPSTEGNPRPHGMPPFSVALNDAEVAAVVSYIRTAWGNNGDLVSPVDAARSRGAPMD